MDTLLNIRRFFDAFKNLSFWQRLFSWASIRSLSYSAYEEAIQLADNLKNSQGIVESIKMEKELLLQERNSLLQQLTDSKTSLTKAEARLQHFDQETKRLEGDNNSLQKKLLFLEQGEDQRKREHDSRIQRVIGLQDNLEKEKQAISAKQLREAEERNDLMKETWKRHEENVMNYIKSICERNAIEYVDNVPFKGKPDNVIKVCDEFIVFDAKSPASDDLSNFNTYIRSQAESVNKYTADDSVRKDIYLVVPSNTIDVLKKLTFHQGNFNVFVITIDALEPVILSLKKIEEYEFAEQLSPEDRQSICRIIGSLLYTSKRRIQVDQFFNSHILDLLSQTQREIPEIMQEEISKHEMAMKLNPTADRRSKEIKQESLEKAQAQLEGQSKIFRITTPEEVHLATAVNG
ncbi:MAG: hypothetical protein JNL40_07500 [Cyclobacteriaceae bacterium]|nr:hypothetical protein [Cyclobacteriaceae bacterium]